MLLLNAFIIIKGICYYYSRNCSMVACLQLSTQPIVETINQYELAPIQVQSAMFRQLMV